MPASLAIAALAALLLSLAFNRLMLAVAPRLGLMDEPGDRRIHHQAIPRAGGIAIYLSLMLVLAAGLGSGLLESDSQLSWRWLGAFAAGSIILIIAGILDDRKGLKPLVKLGAHILAPAVFFLLNPEPVGIFPETWPMWINGAFLVVWAVVLINAFNLIDGLDGLCGGLGLVSVVALAGLALINGLAGSAAILLAMAGALGGFLRYNRHPARIFLGDAGSMLIGFFLATAAAGAVGRRAVVGTLLLTIAIAGVPLLDVLLALWRRSMKRFVAQLRGDGGEHGLFDADADHLHHRLLRSGRSQRKVARLLQGVALLFALFAFLPMFFGDQLLALSLIGLMIIALVGVRNLARIEFADTGSAVHLAIKLPIGNGGRRAAMTLFVYDLLALLAAGGLAVLIETNRFTLAGLRSGSETWHDLAGFVIVFAIVGVIVLFLARIHQRLWVRAGIRDLFSLQCWLLLGAAMSFTLFSLMESAMEWRALRMAILAHAFASIAICLPRVLLDLSREFGLEARHHRHHVPAPAAETPPDQPRGAAVVIGAGDLGSLFLDHLKSSNHDEYPGLRIIGFLDDNPSLKGRRLRSFRIFGGLSAIPGLVESDDLETLILAIKEPDPDFLDRLRTLAKAHDLAIHQWVPRIVTLRENGAATANPTRPEDPDARGTTPRETG